MPFGSTVVKLPDVDSTNNYAANLLRESQVTEGTVVMALFQTAGRGQRGSLWQSNPGENLLMSLILKPQQLEASRQFALNQVLCLALVEYLREDLKIPAQIKWPNDILVDDRKLAGVLIENSIRGGIIEYSIMGVGMNVNQTTFSEGVRATSLFNFSGDQLDVEEVMIGLLPYAERVYADLFNKKLLESNYLSRLYGFEEYLNYRENGEVYSAQITGLGTHGELQLRKRSGEEVTCTFKQVELLGKNGG